MKRLIPIAIIIVLIVAIVPEYGLGIAKAVNLITKGSRVMGTAIGFLVLAVFAILMAILREKFEKRGW